MLDLLRAEVVVSLTNLKTNKTETCHCLPYLSALLNHFTYLIIFWFHVPPSVSSKIYE